MINKSYSSLTTKEIDTFSKLYIEIALKGEYLLSKRQLIHKDMLKTPILTCLNFSHISEEYIHFRGTEFFAYGNREEYEIVIPLYAIYEEQKWLEEITIECMGILEKDKIRNEKEEIKNKEIELSTAKTYAERHGYTIIKIK